jgi:hypothetical protein
MALIAGTKLDCYEVIGLLGAGGMGEVYRTRDRRRGTKCRAHPARRPAGGTHRQPEGLSSCAGFETTDTVAPDSSPVFTRDTGYQEIYALNIKWP